MNEIARQLTFDNTNYNMNIIANHLEIFCVKNTKLSQSTKKKYVDELIKNIKKGGYPIDEYQVKRIRERLGL